MVQATVSRPPGLSQLFCHPSCLPLKFTALRALYTLVFQLTILSARLLPSLKLRTTALLLCTTLLNCYPASTGYLHSAEIVSVTTKLTKLRASCLCSLGLSQRNAHLTMTLALSQPFYLQCLSPTAAFGPSHLAAISLIVSPPSRRSLPAHAQSLITAQPEVRRVCC